MDRYANVRSAWTAYTGRAGPLGLFNQSGASSFARRSLSSLEWFASVEQSNPLQTVGSLVRSI